MGREILLSIKDNHLKLMPGYARPDDWGQVYRDLWLMVGEGLSQLPETLVSDRDLEKITRVALYTASRFKGTRHEIRHSGDHVMVHFLVSVQEYLADGYSDTDEILALILHDVLEDTTKSGASGNAEWEQVLSDIKRMASDNVGEIVVALSKLRSATLDKRQYDYIDADQHATNRQLIETMLDRDGQVTNASLAFARKVWRVKAYDIRHNLRTIQHHKHHDGSKNVTKQLAKARLARDYQVPIMYALGLEKEARVIEDLAMGIISPSLARVAANRREMYGGGDYVSAVEKWWGEQLAKNQELAGVTKPQIEIPRLYALQEEDWEQQKIFKLVLKMGDKEAQRLWTKWSRMYPPVKGMDHQALYAKGTDPWLKVVDLERGYRLAVEVWTPEIEAKRDGALMALFAAKLANTDKNDPASYVQLAAELMNQYSQVGVIEMQDSKGSHVRINKGSRVLDLMYAIEGVDGLRRVTQVLIERDGHKYYLSLGTTLQSGDRLIAYTLEPEDRDIALLDKLDLLSKRYSSGALIALVAYLASERTTVSEQEVYDRGYQILSWLYTSRRGKKLDIYPVLVLGQEEYGQLLYRLGGLKRRARNDQDFTDWMDIMDVYQTTGVLPDGDDRVVVEAILKVDQLIEARKRLPIVRVTLPSDAPYVIEKVGRIMKKERVSAMPFKGESVFDPRKPLGTQAMVEIVLSDEDANKAFKLVKHLRKAFGDAQVECLNEEMRQAGDWIIE